MNCAVELKVRKRIKPIHPPLGSSVLYEAFILSTNDSEVSSDYESLALEREVVPAWHLRLYAQPLCREELMAESSSLSRCIKVDRIVCYQAYRVSTLGVFDTAELS